MDRHYDMHTTKDTWDNIADSFHQTRKNPWQIVTDYIRQLPKEQITADLGCGNGRHTIPLARQSKTTIAIDYSLRLLQHTFAQLTRHKIDNTTLLNASVTHLPLQDTTLDHAIMIASLHTIPCSHNRQQTLRELHRVLKPQSTAMITVWNRQHKAYNATENPEKDQPEKGDILIHWRQHKHDIPRYYHLYTLEELESELEQNSFIIESIHESRLAHTATAPDNIIAYVTKA